VKKEKTDRPGAGGKGGRPKGQRNFIQSQSIFEAGPSEKSIKRGLIVNIFTMFYYNDYHTRYGFHKEFRCARDTNLVEKFY